MRRELYHRRDGEPALSQVREALGQEIRAHVRLDFDSVTQANRHALDALVRGIREILAEAGAARSNVVFVNTQWPVTEMVRASIARHRAPIRLIPTKQKTTLQQECLRQAGVTVHWRW